MNTYIKNIIIRSIVFIYFFIIIQTFSYGTTPRAIASVLSFYVAAIVKCKCLAFHFFYLIIVYSYPVETHPLVQHPHDPPSGTMYRYTTLHYTYTRMHSQLVNIRYLLLVSLNVYSHRTYKLCILLY